LDIGISLSVPQLNDFESLYRHYKSKIKHIQLKRIPELDDTFREQIKEFLLNHSHISISFHANELLNFADDYIEVRKVWIQYAQALITFASDVNARFVNFHLGYFFDDGCREWRQYYLELVIPILKSLLAFAYERDVIVHIENMPQYSRFSASCFIGDRLSDFMMIFGDIHHRHLKLCYDYGHGNLDAYGTDILYQHHNQLGSIHAHNNHQLIDEHGALCQKDMGGIDWKRQIEYLTQINFFGPFIIECAIEKQILSLEYLSELGII